MGIGLRVFFVQNDGRLTAVPLKRFEALMDVDKADEPLPKYAGQLVRCALVVLEFENRRPVAIESIDCTIVKFDKNGGLNRSNEQRKGLLAVESPSSLTTESRAGAVIDARSRFSRKLIAHEHSWQLSPDIKEAIERSIFVQKPSRLRLVSWTGVISRQRIRIRY